jgi:hypothetical protein
MTKGLCIPFLSSTSRKRSMFSTLVLSLITECFQDRCGASRLLIGIPVIRPTGCPDGRAAHAVPPPECLSGSPYDTGTKNALTPESKRIASIMGDLVFQAPRRFFVQTVSDKQNTWSFCKSHTFYAYPCAQVLVICLHACWYLHSKQAPEVVAHTWLVPPIGSPEYLRRGRPNGLPNPICHEPGSQ